MNCYQPLDRQACEDLPIMDIQVNTLGANGASAHEEQNIALLRHSMMLLDECKRLLAERERLHKEMAQWQQMAERDRRQCERLQLANEKLQRDVDSLLATNKEQAERLNQSPARLLIEQLKRWNKEAPAQRLAS